MKNKKQVIGVNIYTPPEGTIQESYGIDIEAELTSMLSEEICKSIDAEILRSLGLEPERNKRRCKSINKIYKKED